MKKYLYKDHKYGNYFLDDEEIEYWDNICEECGDGDNLLGEVNSYMDIAYLVAYDLMYYKLKDDDDGKTFLENEEEELYYLKNNLKNMEGITEKDIMNGFYKFKNAFIDDKCYYITNIKE